MSTPLPDVSGPTAEAARLGEAWELMSVYAELGLLLDSGRADEDYVCEVRDLVTRLMFLGRAEANESDQWWALWMSRNTTFGGDG